MISTYLEYLHLAGLGDGSHDLVVTVLIASLTIHVVAVVGVCDKPQRECLRYSGEQT